ncbi:MAG: hypothetical protein J6V38_07795 [Kiritimatiellae bacterium]|nr:hypothetical protein [Kiritimatiellia bacterium]
MIHERDLQSKCLKWLRDRDIYTINTHGDGWGGKGTPDLTMCVNGRFVCAELKVGAGEMSSAQKLHRVWIERNGGIFFSPYTLGEFIEKMEGIIKNE